MELFAVIELSKNIASQWLFHFRKKNKNKKKQKKNKNAYFSLFYTETGSQKVGDIGTEKKYRKINLYFVT